jgi:hypothetical protein
VVETEASSAIDRNRRMKIPEQNRGRVKQSPRTPK